MHAETSPLVSRAAYISSENQSTGIGIATWFLATTFLIMYVSRQSVKYVMIRKLQLDDYLMTGAVIFSFALSLAYSFASDDGLGNMVISPSQLEAVQKGLYAAGILYIFALCCVKLSLLVFIDNIAIDSAQKRLILYLGVFTSLCTLSSVLAASFQCSASHSWEIFTLHCFDQRGFWIAFGVLDMLTDSAIVLISVVLVWSLHISLSRKAVVVGCFAPRIFVIVAAACRLGFLVPVNAHNNPAYRQWISVVCTELQTCLSISTACIPCIKPFFEGIEAGVWQSDYLRRQGFTIQYLYSKGYAKESTDWTFQQEQTATATKAAGESIAAVENENTEVPEGDIALPVFVDGQWRSGHL